MNVSIYTASSIYFIVIIIALIRWSTQTLPKAELLILSVVAIVYSIFSDDY